MLSNADIYKSRDVTTAETVAQMAQLKYFDEQYLYYGCAYLYEGTIKYRLHENAEKMAAFWEKSFEFGIYPTDISKYVRLLKTPSGKEYEKAEQVQREFALKLAQTYPQELFLALKELGDIAPTDAALAELTLWQDELDLCYERDKIELFSGAVALCFKQKKLCTASYEQFKQWIKARLDLINNCECSIWRDKHWFYGFGYQDGASAQFYANASEFIARSHHYDLMSEGASCTPIFKKAYWFDENPDWPIRKWRSRFEEDMKGLMSEEYQQRLRHLSEVSVTADKEKLAYWLTAVDGEKFPQAHKVLSYYRSLWQENGEA
ncbi:MAG: hypothetical protein DBX41_06740 [Clostridiales bacterium]|nr:MAG: hypothetical protein DBX41_06740 [Clostridiales bacterium]